MGYGPDGFPVMAPYLVVLHKQYFLSNLIQTQLDYLTGSIPVHGHQGHVFRHLIRLDSIYNTTVQNCMRRRKVEQVAVSMFCHGFSSTSLVSDQKRPITGARDNKQISTRP